MLTIDARTIPHDEQRYETLGDYSTEKDVRKVRVSDMGDDDFSFLILLHEMIEQHLCAKMGISDKDIDAFDTQYERDRPENDDSEPGDDPAAPYFDAHQFATCIERLMCHKLGIQWAEYLKAAPL